MLGHNGFIRDDISNVLNTLCVFVCRFNYLIDLDETLAKKLIGRKLIKKVHKECLFVCIF